MSLLLEEYKRPTSGTQIITLPFTIMPELMAVPAVEQSFLYILGLPE